MKQKAINTAAWIALTLWIASLFFNSFHLPGGSLLRIFATITSQFVFIPLFFFTKNEVIEKHYTSNWIRKIQGFCFFIIGFPPLFKLQHWPFATFLFILSFFGLIVIAITLYYVRNPKFRFAQNIALLVVLVLNLIVVKVSSSISQSNINIGFAESYSKLIENNHLITEELNTYDNSIKNDFDEGYQLLELINNIETGVYNNIYQLPEVAAEDMYLYVNDISGSNVDGNVAENAVIGPDKNEFVKHSLSAFHLAELWIPFCKKRIVFHTDSLRTLTSFSFEETTNKEVIKRWVKTEFQHQDDAEILTKLELYRNFVLTELKIDHATKLVGENVALSKVYRDQVFVNFGNQTIRIQDSIKLRVKKMDAFMLMMVLTFLLTILLFFIPNFQLSNQWKMRIILFCLIIVFEFILLLTDFYIGTFSQNPMYLLAVNILLALGLVSLDNFLRNNFLKWYEED